MLNYLLTNIFEIAGIGISVFIAYHIFFLSKRISNSSKLEHKEKVKNITQALLNKIHKDDLRSKVYLVNSNRYFKDYPRNQEKLVSGYSHIRADVKAVRYNGIEFFCSMPEQGYFTKDGNITLNPEGNAKAFSVYQVGVIPYEWIEYVDPEGDEYGYIPLFYCKFKGRIYWKSWWRKILPFGYPFKELSYYKESDVYREGSDPKDMKWSPVDVNK